MKYNALIVGVVAILAQSCATQQSAPKNTDNRPGMVNFSEQGSFWTGKQYATSQDFQAVSKAAAFDKILVAVTTGGYQIATSNKELGLISANQTVSYGQGKTVPLNVIITDNSNGGIKVSLTFTLSGGLSVPTKSVQDEFCRILNSVTP